LYLCFRYLEYHTISLSLHSLTFLLSQKLVGLKGTQGEGKPVGGRKSDASPGQHLAPAIASPQCPQSGCPLKTNPVALGRKKGVATMGVVEIAAREREERRWALLGRVRHFSTLALGSLLSVVGHVA